MAVYLVDDIVAADYRLDDRTGYLEAAMKVRWRTVSDRGNRTFQCSWEFYSDQPELREESKAKDLLRKCDMRAEGWTVSILGDRIVPPDKQQEFLLHYDGFAPSFDRWLPEHDMCPESVAEYREGAVRKTEHTHPLRMRVGFTEDDDCPLVTLPISLLPDSLFEQPTKLLRQRQRWGEEHCLIQYAHSIQRWVPAAQAKQQLEAHGISSRKSDAHMTASVSETRYEDTGRLDTEDIEELSTTVAGPSLLQAKGKCFKRKLLEFYLHDKARKFAAECDCTEEEWQLFVSVLQNATKRTQSSRRKARSGVTVQHEVNNSGRELTRAEQVAALLSQGVNAGGAGPSQLEEQEAENVDDAEPDMWVCKTRHKVELKSAAAIQEFFGGWPASTPYPLQLTAYGKKFYKVEVPMAVHFDIFDQKIRISKCNIQVVAAGANGRPDLSQPINVPQSRGPINRIVGGREWITKRMRT